jgi:spore germination cell wall hydrolase CwlJ-like protein|tara:strand:+ start:415 stop:1140 length:726 start_codon:yes stop_codon:yes gene_type:complete
MENMAILIRTRYVLAILFGFILGFGAFYYLGHPQIEIKYKEIEKIVEKVVTVENTITEIKEVPVYKKQTRIVYLSNNQDEETPTVDPEELECMTLNIYREANNQSMAGQIAVARVVMNRVGDRRYPGTPCKVVYEGPMTESWKTREDKELDEHQRIYYPVRNKCQFSWYCDGKADEVIASKASNIKWKLAQDIAYQVLAFNKWSGMIEGATHYHADYVNPTWARQLRLVGKIDDHIFYRWD